MFLFPQLPPQPSSLSLKKKINYNFLFKLQKCSLLKVEDIHKETVKC